MKIARVGQISIVLTKSSDEIAYLETLICKEKNA